MVDALTAFLVGRLTQEGLTPISVLRVTQGWLPIPGTAQALAVAGGRFWLAQSQLIGGPSLADVPLTEVVDVQVVTGRRRRLDLRTTGSRLRFTVLDDDGALVDFAAAARGGPDQPETASG